MNNIRHRRWSFMRPSRSMTFLVIEALGSVCGLLLLTFLPFRYTVKRPAFSPAGNNRIFQLGQQALLRNADFLDMRDPAGVFSPNGNSGYLSCLPVSGKKTILPEESSYAARQSDKTLLFQPFPEQEPAISPMLPLNKIETVPPLTCGVILTRDGQQLEKIALPSNADGTDGQTVIRLTGCKDFPRSELLQSCGSSKLDQLALQQSRKFAEQKSGVIIVCWPPQKATKKVNGK